MNKHKHWENVYQTKSHREVSWYREHLDTSIRMIDKTGVSKNAAIVDAGGGNSTLVDDLLERGFTDISVLDISKTANTASKDRLSEKSNQVTWITADITTVVLPESYYDLWHDRAAFHFLTDQNDRRMHVDLVKRSVKPGGRVIVASFSLQGPQKCSGLNVVRYSPESVHGEFGELFDLVTSEGAEHYTPFGTTQRFTYC